MPQIGWAPHFSRSLREVGLLIYKSGDIHDKCKSRHLRLLLTCPYHGCPRIYPLATGGGPLLTLRAGPQLRVIAVAGPQLHCKSVGVPRRRDAVTPRVGHRRHQYIVSYAKPPILVANGVAGPLLNRGSVDGLTSSVEAKPTRPVNEMHLGGGDEVYGPLLGSAAVAGRLYDGVSLVVRSIDRLQAFAVRRADQLNNLVFGQSLRCQSQNGSGQDN